MVLLTLALACAQPTHLQYDYGRAYVGAFETQARLDRPSVADDAYPIQGQEALDLRAKARETLKEKSTGTPTVAK